MLLSLSPSIAVSSINICSGGMISYLRDVHNSIKNQKTTWKIKLKKR